MNEIKTTKTIVDNVGQQNARAFWQQFDNMQEKINNLQSKIDKINEYVNKIYDVMDYKDYPPYLDEIYYTLHPELKEDK